MKQAPHCIEQAFNWTDWAGSFSEKNLTCRFTQIFTDFKNGEDLIKRLSSRLFFGSRGENWRRGRLPRKSFEVEEFQLRIKSKRQSYSVRRKQLSPQTKLEAKIGSKEGDSFQLDKVQDGFGDGRKFQLFLDRRIVSLVKFCKQDSVFDNKFKSTVEQQGNGCYLSQDSGSLSP